jgi:hypothetical protein
MRDLEKSAKGSAVRMQERSSETSSFSDSNGDLVADSSTVFSDAVPGAVVLKIDAMGRCS